MNKSFIDYVLKPSSIVKGTMLFACVFLGLISLYYALKTAKKGESIGDWKLFFLCIIIVLIAIFYSTR